MLEFASAGPNCHSSGCHRINSLMRSWGRQEKAFIFPQRKYHIVNLHLPALPVVELCVSDGVAGRASLAVPQAIEWQHIRNCIDERDALSNFCTAKDKCGGAGKRSSRYKSHQGGKYATPDFTRGRIDDGPLRADHRRLFMLCWTARASDVLIRPRSLLNGYENFLKSPACSCVLITLPASS